MMKSRHGTRTANRHEVLPATARRVQSDSWPMAKPTGMELMKKFDGQADRSMELDLPRGRVPVPHGPLRHLIVAAVLVGVAACDSGVEVSGIDSGGGALSDGGPGVDGPLAEAPSISPDDAGVAIPGLYDSSVDFDGIGLDVARLRVTDDGRLIEYDFMGDDVDQGPACYRGQTFEVIETANGQEIGDGVRSADFNLRNVDDGLELSFVDVSDLDDDGDSSEVLSTVLDRIDDVDESSMVWCS